MDVLHYARYPFLKDAAEHVRDRGVTLEDLLTHEAYRQARARGKARVLDALEEGVIGLRPMGTEEDMLEEILSYPVARMFVSGVNDRFLTKRYALAEGVAMDARLERESMEVVEEVLPARGQAQHRGGRDQDALLRLPAVHVTNA